MGFCILPLTKHVVTETETLSGETSMTRTGATAFTRYPELYEPGSQARWGEGSLRHGALACEHGLLHPAFGKTCCHRDRDLVSRDGHDPHRCYRINEVLRAGVAGSAGIGTLGHGALACEHGRLHPALGKTCCQRDLVWRHSDAPHRCYRIYALPRARRARVAGSVG